MQIQFNSPGELARFCKKERERAGMTQRELAAAIGEKRLQAISNAESEQQPSRFAIRQKILRHFGWDVQEVYLVRKEV